MKSQKPKHKKPFHLHVENFFRMQACLGVVLGLFMVAIIKSDSKLMGMIREAYADGYGLIGSYMREETVRTPVTVATIRTTNTSSQ
jgi:hypothetical protein